MKPIPRFGVLRYSATHLLVLLATVFIAAPFIDMMESGEWIEIILVSVLMSSAALAIGARRATFAWAVFLLMPTLAARWVDHLSPGSLPTWVGQATGLVFMAFVVAHLLRFVLRAPRVGREVLSAAVAVYLLLGLAWADVFTLVADVQPRSFNITPGLDGQDQMSGVTALYYSFGTLTTGGSGDITPRTPVARILSVAEATMGTLYLAVLIARLVGLVAPAREES